jgi:hypothetical protein
MILRGLLLALYESMARVSAGGGFVDEKNRQSIDKSIDRAYTAWACVEAQHKREKLPQC